MNPHAAATEYPRPRRARRLVRLRLAVRWAFDQAPFGPSGTRRLLCALLPGTQSAGCGHELAALAGASGGVAVMSTTAAFVLTVGIVLYRR